MKDMDEIFGVGKGTTAWIIDCMIVSFVGLLIFWKVVGLPGTRVYGDDATLWVYAISLLAREFPYPIWDPYIFGGYVPLGFGPTVLLPGAMAVKLGLNPNYALNYSFLIFFLLIGLSVYYLAREVGAPRIISIGLSILSWLPNTIWNGTIWGASYDRIFSVPLFFFAIGITYHFVSRWHHEAVSLSKISGIVLSRGYAIVLLVWIATLLGNVYIAIGTMAVLSVMVLLSFKRITMGFTILVSLLIPALAVTSWQWGRILFHIMDSWARFPKVMHVVPMEFSQLYISGKTWEQTLTYSYMPLITLSLAIGAVAHWKKISTNRPFKALLISVSLWLTFWFITGWIPPLYQYFPRFFATYDSVLHFGLLSIIFMAAFSSFLKHDMAPVVVRSRDMGSVELNVRVPKPWREPQHWISLGVLLLILTNSFVVIPSIAPVDWTPLHTDIDKTITDNINFSDPSLSQYRLAITGRAITRWFNTFHENVSITGGRFFPINDRPDYVSWFDNVVFYRGDLNNLNGIYIEDNPGPLQTFYFDDVNNVATTLFWLDWLGAKEVILFPFLYPESGTVSIYDRSSFVQSHASSKYGYPVHFISSSYSGPVAVETNAKITGFFMSGNNATSNYKLLLASLSYLGLGPSYVIPVLLNKNNFSDIYLDVLVTDHKTYSENKERMGSLTNKGVKILILNTAGVVKNQNTSVESTVLELDSTLADVVSRGPSGSYELVNALFPDIIKDEMTAHLQSSQPAVHINVTPKNWNVTYKINASPSLVEANGSLQVSVKSANLTQHAQADITYSFPKIFDSSDLKVTLQVKSDARFQMSLVLMPVATRDNILVYDVSVPADEWTNISLNGAQFGWKYQQGDLDKVIGFTVVFNLPLNAPQVNFEVRNVSIDFGQAVVYKLPGSVGNNAIRFLRFNGTAPEGLELNIGPSHGPYMHIGAMPRRPIPKGVTVIPLTSAVGKQGSFDEVLMNKNIGDNINIISLIKPDSRSLTFLWNGGGNGVINGLDGKYKGVIWKETFSPNWRIELKGNSTTHGLETSGLYAGPELLYIPLPDNDVETISMHYWTFDYLVLSSLVSSALVLMLFIFVDMRRRHPLSLKKIR